MSADPTQQVAFRLPSSLLDRIDRFALQLGARHPGMSVTRTDAVRYLLTQALDAAEFESVPGSGIRKRA